MNNPHMLRTFDAKDLPFTHDATATGIQDLPNEILCEIFRLASSVHDGCSREHKQFALMPMVLSHVAGHWRELILGLPNLWTNIHMTRLYDPGVLTDMFARSKGLSVDICLDFPGATPKSHMLCLWNIIITVASQIRRCRRLSIRTTTETFRFVYKIFLRTFEAPRLESLELIRTEQGKSPSVFPQMKFNASLLSRICLDGVSWCHPGSRLSGIRDAELRHTEALWLPQILQNTRLKSLTLCQTPTGSVPVTSNSLRSFKIQGDTSHSALDLSSPTSLPETLEISAISPFYWHMTVECLQKSRHQFHRVKSLTLSYLDITAPDLDQRFIDAFPSLTRLHFEQVDPRPVIKLLQDYPTGWPYLQSIDVNGKAIPRAMDVNPAFFTACSSLSTHE